MEQLGYTNPVDYSLYWLLPGKDFGSGLRIVDSDVDTLHMIAVVPKFQYFQLFVDHKKILAQLQVLMMLSYVDLLNW
jgi:hypothetical protein